MRAPQVFWISLPCVREVKEIGWREMAVDGSTNDVWSRVAGARICCGLPTRIRDSIGTLSHDVCVSTRVRQQRHTIA